MRVIRCADCAGMLSVRYRPLQRLAFRYECVSCRWTRYLDYDLRTGVVPDEFMVKKGDDDHQRPGRFRW